MLGLGSGSSRGVKRTDLSQPDPEDEGETFGSDLAEAIEALSDLIADGYDLSMPADTTAGTTVRGRGRRLHRIPQRRARPARPGPARPR
jgi:hypothetical protein